MRFTFSHGKMESASNFAATGATSSRANWRTISRTARCCSEKYSASSISFSGVGRLSGGFRFVGGAQEREESLAVLLDLHRTNATHFAECMNGLGAPHGHFEQRAVREYNIRWHILFPRDARTERAQVLEQCSVAGARHELRRFGRCCPTRCTTQALLYARLGHPNDLRLADGSIVRAEAGVAATTITSCCRIAEISKDESPATTFGVGVLLYSVQLGHFVPAPPIESSPVERESGQRALRVREAVATTKAV